MMVFLVEEFAANLYWALNHDPTPLTPELRHILTWEAATDRLIASSAITKEMQQKSNHFTDKFIAWVLEQVGGGKYGDTLRLLAGGKNAANQIEFINQYGSARPLVITKEEEEGFEKSLTETLKKAEDLEREIQAEDIQEL